MKYTLSSQLPLLSLACLLAAQTSTTVALPPPTYNAANIVANIQTDCPVKNVLFDKSVFDAESLLTMPDVLKKGGVSQQCQDAAVTDLPICFSDGSLQVLSGCCSKVCSTAVKKVVASGCFAEYQKAICSDATAAKVQTGLFYAAKRCGNFQATCGANQAANATSANSTIPAASATTTTKTNITMAALPPASTTANMSAAAPAAPAAPPAAATTAASPRSAAEGKAVMTLLPFVAATAASVLAIVF